MSRPGLLPKHRRLIEAMQQRQGRIIPYRELADVIWRGVPDAKALRCLQESVHLIRRCYEDEGHTPVIATVRGYGYVWIGGGA